MYLVNVTGEGFGLPHAIDAAGGAYRFRAPAETGTAADAGHVAREEENMYLTSDFLVHVMCIPYVCHLSDMCIPCILPCVSHVSDMCMARFSHVSDMTCVRHVSVRHVSDMFLTCVCHVSDTCYIAPRSRRKSLSRAARGAARQGGRRRRSRRGRRRLLSRTRRRRRSRRRSRRL